jgi:hypothetical protein
VPAEALALGLRAALTHAPLALTELETHTLPALVGAGASALAGASPLGPLLPPATAQALGEAWEPSLLLNDAVLPLRLAAASQLRCGALTLSLWEAYTRDKVELVKGGGPGTSAPAVLRLAAQGRAAAAEGGSSRGYSSSSGGGGGGGSPSGSYHPFTPTLPRESLSVYLAALATVTSTGGSAEDSDALSSSAAPLLPPHAAAASAHLPLAPHLALAHARAAICTMAEGGSLPNLEDLVSLVRLYASAGLMPDARLLVRMLLAPSLRRDYTQAALEKDAEEDAKRLAGALGAPAAQAWHAWPGQGEVLTLGVSTSGLAFGAPHPSAVFDLSIRAALQTCSEGRGGAAGGAAGGGASASSASAATGAHPLPLTARVFALIALALGATGLCEELLPYLIEVGAEQEEAAARRGVRHVILDGGAALAVYGAWAMAGNGSAAEGVLSDPRFDLRCKGSVDAPGLEAAAARDAALSAVTRMPSRTAPPTLHAPLLALHLPWAPATPAILANTLRVYAALSGGAFYRAFRLVEGAGGGGVGACLGPWRACRQCCPAC